MSENLKIDKEIEGICPCGKGFTAGIVAEGEMKGAQLVTHAEPICDEFKKLEPHEFLAYVRKSWGIKAPWDDWN